MNEKRLSQQIATFKNILDQYNFEGPLARFLSGYFRRNKQMGSKDRKTASRLIYNYLRLGIGLDYLPITTRLAIGEFLCTTSSDFVQLLEPNLSLSIEQTLEEKLLLIHEEYGFSIDGFFPLSEEISSHINKKNFLLGHFLQRDLFIRLRSGYEQLVTEVLSKKDIPYKRLGQKTLQLRHGLPLDRIKEIAGRYEVQDLSSQRVVNFLHPKNQESWWDACAGSGGKSLLLKEVNPTIQLLVSDVRMSILRNLDERFDKAGIKKYRKKIVDLTKDTSDTLGKEMFDAIIVDIPCSGSGTWSRTPEQMSTFTLKKLEEYCRLQREILNNVIAHLKFGKSLIYITCSVFKSENEDQLEYLNQKGFKIDQVDYIEGSVERADTLFVAKLSKVI